MRRACHPVALLILISLTAAPALAAQTADPKHPRTIVVVTHYSKAETAEKASAGLVEAGYALDRVDSTTIIPAVRNVKNVVEVHLRLNLLTSGDSTKVVVSATYDIPNFQAKNQPAEANRSGMKKLIWQEVESAASAVAKQFP